MKDEAPERIWALIPPASPAMSGGWRDTVPPAHWSADAVEYRRADAPPTLAEAMTVPDVKALVDAAEKIAACVHRPAPDVRPNYWHVGAGKHVAFGEAMSLLGAALANMKKETPHD
jgi:hypothetical protein